MFFILVQLVLRCCQLVHAIVAGQGSIVSYGFPVVLRFVRGKKHGNCNVGHTYMYMCTNVQVLHVIVMLPVCAVFEGPPPAPGQLCEGEDSK